MGLASAQTLLPSQQAEADVQTAYSTLAQNTGIRFDISGTQSDAVGNGQPTVIPITGELYYNQTIGTSGQTTVNVDLWESLNGIELFELIADGQNVWVYRPAAFPTTINRGSYSASPYNPPGPVNAPQNPNYMHDLMSALTAGTPSGDASSYAVRLVRELFVGELFNEGTGGETNDSSTSAVYHSWIPMNQAIGPVEIAFPPAYQDPVTGLYANPTTGVEQAAQPTTLPETWYVIYNMAPKRAVAFELVQPNANGPTTLNRIYYSERLTIGNKTRVNAWTITPVATTDFTAANFKAYPAARLAGWRPIIGPKG